MRMIQSLAAAFLVAAAITLAGCTAAPVKNVTNASFAAPAGQLTMEEVQDAIIRAGSSLGWRMKPVAPGHIVGVLHIRTHVAKVDIRYNTQTYDILYKDSKNLEYTGKKIHRNYNSWVQNLSDAIYNQIAMM